MNFYLKILARIVLVVGLCARIAHAEDIDIFVGSAGGDSTLPNVIFVLDNTSNWARQSQQWPGGLTQGQSEVRAINTSLAGLVDKVNVGLVEFTTEGNAGQDGGYVRFNLQKLTEASRTQLGGTLTKIFNDVNEPIEKRNANTAYGNLMYDFYNYLIGSDQSYSGEGTPNLADPTAYTSLYGQFKSPLSPETACSNTYLIFIGNPNQSGPTDDSSANSAALRALYTAMGQSPDGLAGSSGAAPLVLPGFTVTEVTEPSVDLGYSKACYKDEDVAACTAAESMDSGLCFEKTNCACSVTSKTQVGGDPTCITGNPAKNNTFRMAVLEGGGVSTVVEPSSTTDTVSGRAWNFDDWAKFLHDYGVPISYLDADGQPQVQRSTVITYTIDVFNKQQDPEQTSLMLSAADVGGGRYFAARNEDAIVDAITSALSDILSVSSTFTAVTLPLSATNRAEQENQVFIGMFRPDQGALPRWFGNLKRYQIALFNGRPELADARLKPAVNPASGFLGECAESLWSQDSGDYWAGLGVSPPPRSLCLDPANTNSVWSDLPDGPFVEKGGVAQLTRESDLDQRNILTVSGTSLSGLTVDSDVLNYLLGDLEGVDEAAATSGGRPSIHGDVIHSRPLLINFGGTEGVYVYYGANDGLLRSVRAWDAKEVWSLISPEHLARIERLYENEPLIAFPNQDMTVSPTPTAKDYFFDGSLGQIISYADNRTVDLAYIFPSMRRGGRMVYGLDVTSPASPSLLWRRGCPNLGNDDGCDTGLSDLGQTWSTPLGGYIKGYSDADGNPLPVVMFGGGYDNCLDSDQAAYPSAGCSAAKGKKVYVLDAEDGTVLASLNTDAPIVAELASVDMDFDGNIDYAYAADATGNLWRVNFAAMDVNGVLTPLAKTAWSITKVAATLDPNRRFLNQPTVASFKTKVYVSIGSGNRERPLESNYPYVANVTDRFYTFIDTPGVASATVDLDSSPLLNVTEVDSGVGVDCDVKGVNGWYMDLLGRGEQVVNPAVIAAGKVMFNTYRPGEAASGMCTRPLGIATGYTMNLFSPSACDTDRSRSIIGGGMPIPPIIATVRVPQGCTGDFCPSIQPSDPEDLDVDGDGEVSDDEYPPNDDPLLTICVGCEGLKPTEIEPETDQVRTRVYWNSDIDRE